MARKAQLKLGFAVEAEQGELSLPERPLGMALPKPKDRRLPAPPRTTLERRSLEIISPFTQNKDGLPARVLRRLESSTMVLDGAFALGMFVWGNQGIHRIVGCAELVRVLAEIAEVSPTRDPRILELRFLAGTDLIRVRPGIDRVSVHELVAFPFELQRWWIPDGQQRFAAGPFTIPVFRDDEGYPSLYSGCVS